MPKTAGEVSRARLAALLVAVGVLSWSCTAAPPPPVAPPPPTAPTAARAVVASSAPMLVVQRHVASTRRVSLGEWDYLLIQDQRRLALVEAEGDVVRGYLDDACASVSVGASADGRWVIAPSCTRPGLFHVWSLEHDSVRDVDLGPPGPDLWFAAGGPWLAVSFGDRASLLDLESGTSADVSPPKGSRVERIEVGGTGGAIVHATSERRSGAYVFPPRAVRSYDLEYPAGVWGHTLLGGDVVEYGSNVVRRRPFSDVFRDAPPLVEANGAERSWMRNAAGEREGAEPPRLGIEADLCEPTAATGVTPSTDGRYLVVRCQPPLDGAYFLVTTPALDRPKRLVTTVPSESPAIDVGRDTIVISSDSAHHELFDLATGDRLGPIAVHTNDLGKGGKRYRGAGDSIRSTIDDRLIWSARSNVFEGAVSARGDLLVVGDAAFDTRRRASLTATRASRDGRIALRQATSGEAVVFDREAGTSWVGQTSASTGAATVTSHDLELSPSGRWVISSGVETSDANRPSILLFASAASAQRTYEAAQLLFAVSANDVLASIARLSDGPCPGAGAGAAGDTCATVRLDDLTRRTSRTLPIPNVDGLAFTPRGDRLFTSGDAWDPDTKKIVWSVPEGERFDAFAADANLAVLVDDERGYARLVDATSGAERGRFIGVDRLLAARGSRVLLGGRRRVTSVDLDTLGARELPPVPDDAGPAIVSDDGAYLWFVADGFVVARRLADGRELSWLEGDVAPITDELVFDPKDAARVPLRVRESADVLHARMSPADAMGATHGHPNLVDDFFAGRDVSPRSAK